MAADAYLPHMMRDKKVLAGEMRLVLPLAIGKSEIRGGVPHDVVLGAIADTAGATIRRSGRVRAALSFQVSCNSREHKPFSGVLNG